MESICGVDCCSECPKLNECGGCTKTQGHPFGGRCVAAECVKQGGFDKFHELKNTLINEINALNIENLKVSDLNLLNGFFVNMEYELPNGQKVKLLEDNNIYWGNQIETPGSDRCLGVSCDDKYILVCEYGCDGSNPQIVEYKRR